MSLPSTPSLTSEERLALEIIRELTQSDIRHRYADWGPPLRRVLWEFGKTLLYRPFVTRRAWLHLFADGLERKHGDELARRPKDRLPLYEYWQSTIYAKTLTPCRVEEDELWFDTFFVAHRVCRGRSEFTFGHGEAEYLVAAPTSATFRAIAVESSLRWFCTDAKKNNCLPPEDDDFGIVRVSGRAFDESGRLTVPCEMSLGLPQCYGEWQLIQGEWGPSESVVEMAQ